MTEATFYVQIYIKHQINVEEQINELIVILSFKQL